jgi:hypothetical protein
VSVHPGQQYRAIRGKHAGKVFDLCYCIKFDGVVTAVLDRGGRKMEVPASELLNPRLWVCVMSPAEIKGSERE